MKQVLFLCLIFISVVSKSQTPFNVEYEADYKLVYKDQNIPNAPTQDAAFALLMNREESYFKNLGNYTPVYTSLLKIKEGLIKLPLFCYICTLGLGTLEGRSQNSPSQ